MDGVYRSASVEQGVDVEYSTGAMRINHWKANQLLLLDRQSLDLVHLLFHGSCKDGHIRFT